MLEDAAVRLRPGVKDLIQTLDQRGILHSIASKNDPVLAMETLRRFGLADYFLYAQVNWNSKAASIQAIAKSLNIGLDSLAFIDDQPFELAEVAFSLPQVLLVNAAEAELAKLPLRPEFIPLFITEDSKNRRALYRSDQVRNQAEAEYTGPKEEFLATLGMVFNIRPAGETDLRRAEELTIRTNQLNTTGRTYSYEELDSFRLSPNHKLLVAGLEDRFGSYGKIGLALLECRPSLWTLKLLLVSCRVMSRGVGNILLQYIIGEAAGAGARLQVEFIPNDRNRMMYITYKFAGFTEVARVGDCQVLESRPGKPQPFPNYVKIEIES